MRGDISVPIESLKFPPKRVDVAFSDGDALRVGDLHGNPLYLIYILATAGVISISDEGYKQLAVAYFAEQDDDFEWETIFIEAMQEHVKFDYNDLEIKLLGDIFCDRGRLSDDAMRELLHLILESGNTYSIDDSNHDKGLLDLVFHKNIETEYRRGYGDRHVDDIKQLYSNGTYGAPGDFYQKLGRSQANTTYRFVEKVKRYPHLLHKMEDFLKHEYFPCVVLSDITLKNGVLYGGSHAVVGFETFIEAAEQMGVPLPKRLTPENFKILIGMINRRFREIHFAGDNPIIFTADEAEAFYSRVTSGEAVALKDALFRFSHNRVESTHASDGQREAQKLELDPEAAVRYCLRQSDIEPQPEEEDREVEDILKEWRRTERVLTFGHEGYLLPEADQIYVHQGKDAEEKDARFKEMFGRNPCRAYIPRLREARNFRSTAMRILDNTQGREGAMGKDGKAFTRLSGQVTFDIGPGDSGLTHQQKKDRGNVRRLEAKIELLGLRAHFLLDMLVNVLASIRPEARDSVGKVHLAYLDTFAQQLAIFMQGPYRKMQHFTAYLSQGVRAYLEKTGAIVQQGFDAVNSICTFINYYNPAGILSESQLKLMQKFYKTLPRAEYVALQGRPKREWQDGIEAQWRSLLESMKALDLNPAEQLAIGDPGPEALMSLCDRVCMRDEQLAVGSYGLGENPVLLSADEVDQLQAIKEKIAEATRQMSPGSQKHTGRYGGLELMPRPREMATDSAGAGCFHSVFSAS